MEDGTVGKRAGEPSTISFRELGRSDFPLLQKWLAAPHVAAWWNERFDLASLEKKYGPAIDGREPIHIYLISARALRSAGFNGIAGAIFQDMRCSSAPTRCRQESISRSETSR